jgi:hypothetical protein
LSLQNICHVVVLIRFVNDDEVKVKNCLLLGVSQKNFF